MVLIETYWNVKDVAKAYEDSIDEVLIETYWNVKQGKTGSTGTRGSRVLIETYWNVKLSDPRNRTWCKLY